MHTIIGCYSARTTPVTRFSGGYSPPYKAMADYCRWRVESGTYFFTLVRIAAHAYLQISRYANTWDKAPPVPRATTSGNHTPSAAAPAAVSAGIRNRRGG